MAMLDAIISPEWDGRYYSFNAKWSAKEQMGSMKNGSGDDLFVLFNRTGCWIKGFAHEAAMTPHRTKLQRVWPGVLDSVPPDFGKCLKEPAFSVEDTTFCIWRRHVDSSWQKGEITFPESGSDPDGSQYLLSPLDGQPDTYQDWAEGYYERDVSLEAVIHIYAHRPITSEVIAQLNPDMTLAGIRSDIHEIGYK